MAEDAHQLRSRNIGMHSRESVERIRWVSSRDGMWHWSGKRGWELVVHASCPELGVVLFPAMVHRKSYISVHLPDILRTFLAAANHFGMLRVGHAGEFFRCALAKPNVTSTNYSLVRFRFRREPKKKKKNKSRNKLSIFRSCINANVYFLLYLTAYSTRLKENNNLNKNWAKQKWKEKSMHENVCTYILSHKYKSKKKILI